MQFFKINLTNLNYLTNRVPISPGVKMWPIGSNVRLRIIVVYFNNEKKNQVA